MERTRMKFYLDVGMTSLFLLCLGTGIAKFAPITRFLALKSAAIAPITLVHDWSGIAFGGLILVHLAFNWKWMVAMTRKTGTKPHRKAVAQTESPAAGVLNHE
jgi:hypothetical protein